MSRPARQGGRVPPAARDPQAGLTLVEMLVALALFAVIAAAGFAVLGQVIRVQAATGDRLDRLAGVQRSMYVLTQDFLQTTGGSLVASGGGVAFRRSAGSGQISVRYALEGSSFVRELSGDPGAGRARQTLLDGVRGVGWQFYDPGHGWRADWPPRPSPAPANPAAVAVELTLAGPGLSGSLRRVLPLPAEAAP